MRAAPGMLESMRRAPYLSFLLAVVAAAAQTPTGDPVRINAPYVTTPDEVVEAMLRLAKVDARDNVYDLGCGDGRIVIAAAKKFGARGVGIDLNPERIREARANAQKAGVEALLRFQVNDLFDSDIHPATVVALYLLPDLNLRLRPKLLKELKPGSRVISHDFHMGDWKADKEQAVGSSRIYLWTIPAK
jgi:SAM-dependent methyltransferase